MEMLQYSLHLQRVSPFTSAICNQSHQSPAEEGLKVSRGGACRYKSILLSLTSVNGNLPLFMDPFAGANCISIGPAGDFIRSCSNRIRSNGFKLKKVEI